MKKTIDKKYTVNQMSITNNFVELDIDVISTGCINIGTTYEGDVSKKVEKKLKDAKHRFENKKGQP